MAMELLKNVLSHRSSKGKWDSSSGSSSGKREAEPLMPDQGSSKGADKQLLKAAMLPGSKAGTKCHSSGTAIVTAAATAKASKLKKELSSTQREVKDLKAQLADAKVKLAGLVDGAAHSSSSSEDRIGTEVAHETPHVTSTASVAVQAKPPVEVESRIPRTSTNSGGSSSMGEEAAVHVTAARVPSRLGASTSSSSSSQRGAKLAPGSSPARGSASKSRIPPSPAKPARTTPRTYPRATKAAAAAAGTATQQTPSEAGAAAFTASSRMQRADWLASQLKVAEAFRSSLEGELRDARFENVTLQTQVLSLQSKLERALGAHVLELDTRQALRRGSGGGHYEAALAALAAVQTQLADSESARAVAEQQAIAATDMAADSKEQLQAMVAEAAGLRQELNAALAKVLQLTAETATLQQQLLKLRGAQASAEALTSELAYTRAAAEHADRQHGEVLSKLHEELANQKAITDTTNQELLQLSACHAALKGAFQTLQSESKQHAGVVQLVQHELEELSYYAAAGRVALGLCSDGGEDAAAGCELAPEAAAASASIDQTQEPQEAAAASSQAVQAPQQPVLEPALEQPVAGAPVAAAAAGDGLAPRRERRKKRKQRRRKHLEKMEGITEADEEEGEEEADGDIDE